MIEKIPKKFYCHFFNERSVIALIIMLLFCNSNYAQTIRYVKTNGQSSSYGLSWETASNDIQEMINVSNPGDVIKVAAGTYKPNRTGENPSVVYTGNDNVSKRKRTFLLKNGVTIIGGFASDVTSSTEKFAPIDNKTILSGDFDGNDTYSENVVINNNSENAYNVVTIAASSNHNYTLKGFHITGGNANNNSTITINGVPNINLSRGGGINVSSNASSTPAVYNSNTNFAVINISSCVLYNNSAIYGGAVRFTNKVVPLIESSIFYKNYASQKGGAISSSAYRLDLESNTFYENKANVEGGAYHGAVYNDEPNAFVKHSFSLNIFDNNKKANNVTNVFGSDFAFGTSTTSNDDNNKISAQILSYLNNRIQYDNVSLYMYTTEGIIDLGGNYINFPVEFANVNQNDFRVNFSFDLVDVDYSNTTISQKVDVNGLPREVMSGIDMGAHEWQFIPDSNGVIHIKQGSKGYGRSWSDAAGDLALVNYFIEKSIRASLPFNSAPNPNFHGVSKIYISEGIYTPKFGPTEDNPFTVYSSNNRYSYFMVYPNVSIYGGFPATGNPTLNDRNFSLYPTVLSGDLNNDDIITGSGSNLVFQNRSDNVYNLLIALGEIGDVVIDGINLQGAHSDLEEATTYSNSNQINSIYVDINSFSALLARINGGNFKLLNCKFKNNYTIGDGYNSSTVKTSEYLAGISVVNCEFSSNISDSGVSIFSFTASSNNSSHLVNSTFYGNKLTDEKVIDLRSNYNMPISNTVIVGNSTSSTAINPNKINSFNNSFIQGFTNTVNENINSNNLTATDLFESINRNDSNFLVPNINSVLRNTGRNLSYLNTFPSKDLKSNQRNVGTSIDIGAYENQCDISAPTASSQTFCSGATVANLVATGSNLKWYNVQTGGTVLANTTLLTTGTYYVSQTVNNCESTRTLVSVVVNNITQPTAGSQTFCSGATVGDLVATGSSLKWYNVQTGGTALTNSTLLTTGTYYVSQTVNNCESLRVSVSITVNNTIQPTAISQTFCSGATVANLVATGSNLKWYNVQTGGSALANSTLLATGTYYVSQTANSCESTRTLVSVVVNSTTQPTASPQTFCSGATVGDLVATGSNLKWYNVQTGGTALTNSTLLTAGTYYVSQTIDNCESTRTSVSIVVNNPTQPTSSSQTFCSGATVANLVATGSNLKWYNVQNGGSALTNSTLLTTGTYYVSQTISNCESTRTSVSIVVNNTTQPSASSQTFCFGATVGDLVATGSNLKWYNVQTGGSALTNSTLLATGTYYVSQTANSCESTRVAVNVIINSVQLPTSNPQIFCNEIIVANLVATGNSLKWYNVQTGGSVLNDNFNVVSGTYYVSQTINGCESERLPVNVTILSNTLPITQDQTFCGAANVSNLLPSGAEYKWYSSLNSQQALSNSEVLVSGNYYVSRTNGQCETEKVLVRVTTLDNSAPNIQNQTVCLGATINQLLPVGSQYKWYRTSGLNSQLTSTEILSSGTYYVTQTNGSCESLPKQITINVIDVEEPLVNNLEFCETATVNDLLPNGSEYKWYSNAQGGQQLLNTSNLVSGTYYVSKSENNCESERVAVQVLIKQTDAPQSDNQTFCMISNPTVADLLAQGENVKWYESPTGGNMLSAQQSLENNKYYYATQTISNCESSTRTSILVTINDVSSPVISNQSFCTVTHFADINANGLDIRWYSNDTTTQSFSLNDEVVTGTYYVSQIVNGCESVIRKAVEIQVNITPMPFAQNQQYCQTDNKTVGDLLVTGSNVKWYNSNISNTPLLASDLLTSGNYYATQTLNNCESQERRAIEVVIENIPQLETNNVSVCPNTLLQNILIDGRAFDELLWYNNLHSTTPLVANTNIDVTRSFYVTYSNGNCEAPRKLINVNVLPNVPMPQASTIQHICGSGTVADLEALGDNGSVIKWYSSSDSSNVLSQNHNLLTGTYYVSQQIGDCESNRVSVAVIINSTIAPSTTQLSICEGTNANEINFNLGSNSVMEWYNSPTSSTTLGSNFLLESRDYYIARNTNGCISERTRISVIVNAIPNSPTGELSQSLPISSTLENLFLIGDNILWFSTELDALNNENPLNITTELEDGKIYYAVLVSEAGCRSLPTAVTVSLYLSGTKFNLDNLKVYPNPTQDFVNISYSKPIEKIEVYSLLGNLLMFIQTKDQNVKLDISSYQSGTYIVKITSDNLSEYVKIVKK